MNPHQNDVAIIVAADELYGIGKEQKIPWNNKTDMKFFKDTTQNSICVMGRTTYESIKAYAPNRTGSLLLNRISIVVSSTLKGSQTHSLLGDSNNVQELDDGSFVVDSVEIAVLLAEHYLSSIPKNIFFLGGVKIYKDSLPFINKIYLNSIKGNYNCDTFFPVGILDGFHKTEPVKLSDDVKSTVYHKDNNYNVVSTVI